VTAASSSQATTAGTLRILLAEENPINQKVALRILERLGYEADIASDGQEVLERLERAPYDVIFMDVQTRRVVLAGNGTPSPLSATATAFMLRPSAYRRKIRRTISASGSKTTHSAPCGPSRNDYAGRCPPAAGSVGYLGLVTK
jgi:hypothetical protein